MRALPTLALAVPLLFGAGCFAFDELDAGMEIMEAHSPKNRKDKKKSAQQAEGEKPPTYQQVVQSWWKDAKTLSVSPGDREASDDPMIPCAHAGKTVYTRRSDCVARGGNPG